MPETIELFFSASLNHLCGKFSFDWKNLEFPQSFYDGDTPESIREQVKADFNRSVVGDGPYKWQVVLANYKTGGVGLNFTAATQMIILDEEWNPGKEEQLLLVSIVLVRLRKLLFTFSESREPLILGWLSLLKKSERLSVVLNVKVMICLSNF
jgi:hypothetical protein